MMPIKKIGNTDFLLTIQKFKLINKNKNFSKRKFDF